MFRVIDARDLTQGTSLRIVNIFYLISFLLSSNALLIRKRPRILFPKFFPAE